ncbi:hypothetical protein ACWEJ6_36770 [Nonomuraea sp. NPDC004702]
MHTPIVLIPRILPAIGVMPTFVSSLIPFYSRAVPPPSGLIAACCNTIPFPSMPVTALRSPITPVRIPRSLLLNVTHKQLHHETITPRP